VELRQLEYFLQVAEAGSFSRAARNLGVPQSVLSVQVAKLEGELFARLLERSARGVNLTEAGQAFRHEARLTLRHAEQCVRVARQATLSGSVTIGLPPTTASVLGMELIVAMRREHPNVRLHLVEGMSGHLSTLLDQRQLDMAVLFDSGLAHRKRRNWTVSSLLHEDLFFICSKQHLRRKLPASTELSELFDASLILPSEAHGLRRTLDAAFAEAAFEPNVVLEIDSLAMLMEAVSAGLGATIQPWAAVSRFNDVQTRFHVVPLRGESLSRESQLCCLSDEEATVAAFSTKAMLLRCVAGLVSTGKWHGARLPPTPFD